MMEMMPIYSSTFAQIVLGIDGVPPPPPPQKPYKNFKTLRKITEKCWISRKTEKIAPS